MLSTSQWCIGLRVAVLAAGSLLAGGGCITYYDERNAQAMEEAENQRVLNERLKRIEGQIEGLQMENQRLGTEIENVRRQMDTVGQSQSRLMQGQVEDLAKRIRALDEARASDRQAMLDDISRKVAELINRRSAAGGSTSTGGGGASTTRAARSARLRSACHSHAARPAAGRKIVCGIAGIMPIAASTTATGSQVPGEANWPPIWPARSRLSETRVTITAAAIESSSAGTCATSASPMASVM